MRKKIAIIGGGNLGTAMAEGLLASGFCQPKEITITRRRKELLENFLAKGCKVHSNNKKAVKESEVILLAIKPYNYQAVIEEIKAELKPQKHLIISVITGVWMADLQKAIGQKIPIVRAMPNTAIAIRQSMTCLAQNGVAKTHINYAEQLFAQLGKTVVIQDKLMDAATVLGACGTAYAMRFVRANIQGGIEIGFDAPTASLIAAQTIKGAASLLLEKGTHPEQEIDKVTTPMGCTIAGLNEMEHQGFSSALIKGLKTSYQKIEK